MSFSTELIGNNKVLTRVVNVVDNQVLRSLGRDKTLTRVTLYYWVKRGGNRVITRVEWHQPMIIKTVGTSLDVNRSK